MIALVEGAKRQKTPNELALNILLAALTVIFMLAVITLQPIAFYCQGAAEPGRPGGLARRARSRPRSAPCCPRSASPAWTGWSQRNVLAMSGRAVEAAGDVNTLLLDKTGTITIGNRQATEFLPVDGVSAEDLADAAQLSSMADYTPEGRSIVVLAKDQYGLRERHEGELKGAEFVEFTAQTRMSGVDLADGARSARAPSLGLPVDPGQRRHSAGWTSGRWWTAISGVGRHPAGRRRAGRRQRHGSAGRAKALGVIYLKDIVKEGIAERFAEMRKMGIRTVMITGDNPLTAKAIADESGVDDFLAEATPEGQDGADQEGAGRRAYWSP